ncbi:MAG: hypothetical protein Q8S23_06100 [Bacteroidales bacterium]|nr:hypothetical protein [Bacteroidales bacterium]
MKDYPFSNLNDSNENTTASFDEIKWGSRSDIVLVVALVLIAGLIAKIPAILGINEEFFYTRNVGFIIFPALTAFFVFKNRLSKTHIRVITLFTLVALIFINSLPDVKESDTLILSSIHILLLLWAVLGFTFTGGRKEKFIPIFNYNKQAKDKADAKFSLSNQPEKNIQLSENSSSSSNSPLEFLKYNGDLIVMSTLILIAGGIMSAITIGLFNLIGLNIEGVYFDYVAIFGLAATPIVGTYIIRTNPNLVGKVSPLIARIFSPLVLIMLVIFLSAIAISGKNPYNDREFLIIFNALLVGVMAIIFFSVSGRTGNSAGRFELWILTLLSAVTVLVNAVALSAIIYRIFEWGITPNRAAVLGLNTLIFLNLIFVTIRFIKVIAGSRRSISGNAITDFLPLYILWAAIVTFLFPFVF